MIKPQHDLGEKKCTKRIEDINAKRASKNLRVQGRVAIVQPEKEMCNILITLLLFFVKEKLV